MDREQQAVESLRAEAASLFSANQAGRGAAERSIGLVLTLTGVSAAVGINAGTAVVLLPLAPICLLLVSSMFQQFVEVTVTGAAREILEARLAERLGEATLFYEHAVAPIRKQAPLALGVRVLQGLSALLVIALLVAATAVALDDQRWYVLTGYLVGTALALLSAGLSYADMLSSGEVAKTELAAWRRREDGSGKRHAGNRQGDGAVVDR